MSFFLFIPEYMNRLFRDIRVSKGLVGMTVYYFQSQEITDFWKLHIWYLVEVAINGECVNNAMLK